MLVHESKLEYFVSQKNEFIVVAFVGSMTKLTASTIEKCTEELAGKPGTRCVLSFHDVTQLEPGAVPALVKLQKSLRDRSDGQVRLCFLQPVSGRFWWTPVRRASTRFATTSSKRFNPLR